jgi:NAD(P)-dependent dehydrogenase (short-subunit alcohol dehydrogenase family)
MSKLRGKTALVTGGSSGIGLAVARRFAMEGATVLIAGRKQHQLDQALAQIGHDAEAIQADVTRTADLDRLFARVADRAARLDVLVTSSGIAEYAPLEQITEAHIDRAFDLNVRAMVLTVQRAARLMAQGGSIVLVGSIASTIANPGYATYSASKAAVRSYARTWTHELAGRGIRVNTLSPGPTDTPMFDDVGDDVRKTLTSQIPFGRLGRPDEIASAALFLASDESSYVGGADLHVDGGMVA